MRRIYMGFALSIPAIIMAAPSWAVPSWMLSTNFQVQEQYTDNLFLTKDNEEDDFITLLSAGLTLQAKAKSWGLNLNYRPAYSFYQEYSEFNSLRHNASLSFKGDLSKHLHFSLRDAYTRSEQPDDPARDILPPGQEDLPVEEADYTLRQGREPRSTNTLSSGLEYVFGPKNRAYVQYSMRHFWSDSPSEEDSYRSSPSIGLEYWFGSHSGLNMSAGYTHGGFDRSEDFDSWNGSIRYIRNFTRFFDGYLQYSHRYMEFDTEETSFDTGQNDYSVYEPSAGISYRFSPGGSFSFGVGYYVRDRENRDNNQSGLLLNTSINQSWDLKRGGFRLRASSGYTETYFGAENLGFTIYYQVGGYYQYALAKRLNWNLSADYRYNDYKDTEPDRNDNLLNLGTGLSYLLTREVSMDLSYSFRLRDSSLSEQDYDENRISLSISWSPRGWRLN